jgi:hypothetical protein
MFSGNQKNNTDLRVTWPIVKPVTDKILSLLPADGLAVASEVCRFFQASANRVALHRLENEFGIIRNLDIPGMHISMLKFLNKVRTPILTLSKPEGATNACYRPYYDPTRLISREFALLTVAKKISDESLCLLGLFRITTDDPTIFNLCQFSVSIDNKGKLKIETVTMEESKKQFSIIESMSCMARNFNHNMLMMYKTVIKNEITSLENLIREFDNDSAEWLSGFFKENRNCIIC